VTPRPKLMHERLGDVARAELHEAQTVDMAQLKRWQLADMLFNLKHTRRLEAMSGTIATRLEWDEAEVRLQTEINSRPPARQRTKA
jgi:hypothetical protein